jgi:hypothetical protein
VLEFFLYFGFAYIATTLLATGLNHVGGFTAFRDLVKAHGIVPSRWILPVVSAIVVLELVAGGLAIGLLVGALSPALAAPVFALCACAGFVFLLYIRRLLQQPVRTSSCGCLPVSTPLTQSSLTPSGSLVVVSVSGLAAAANAQADAGASGPVVLAALWGVTLASLLVLSQAALPAAVGGGRQ